jgi:hypothetical protein
VPVLIAMCGLPFSGKAVLAEALSRELRIRLLSYDHGIYPVHSRSAPTGSSVAAEYDFLQAIARREIGAILASGESLDAEPISRNGPGRPGLATACRVRGYSPVRTGSRSGRVVEDQGERVPLA